MFNIWSNNYTPQLGEFYTITYQVSGLHTQVTRFYLSAKTSFSTIGSFIDQQTSNKFGEFNLRAVMGADIVFTGELIYTWCGEEKTKEYTMRVIEKFPDRSEILNKYSISMNARFLQGVQESMNQGAQIEYGDTYYKRSDDIWEKWPDIGTPFACGSVAKIPITDRRQEASNFNSIGRYAVGWFHSHPPLFVCANNSTVYSRTIGESPDDINVVAVYGFPAFFWDYNKINGILSSNDGYYTPSKLYHFGPDCKASR